MNILDKIFRKKEIKAAVKEKEVPWNAAIFQKGDNSFEIKEPWTFAKHRLEVGAKDIGSDKAKKAYNKHTSRVQNQWINPLQSINTGFGNAQYSFYNYQNVNYFECYALAQDPLFQTVFDILSTTPMAKGGVLQGEGIKPEIIEKLEKKYRIRELNERAIRSNYVTGGCLIYMDFGKEGLELEEPLNLKKQDMRKFKGFIHIDPINITAINVNTVNPAASDYMNPDRWYVVGLGGVHASHFLKYEANIPELPMRPLCLFFGFPLTSLIKQDIANSNLASQGLANLLNRFRYLYLKSGDVNFATGAASAFRDRLEAMSMIQDNWMVTPLKQDEEIIQITSSITGMDENVEFFYRIVAAKTGIPFNKLMGKQEATLGARDDGSMRNWYDKVRTIQEDIKNNMLVQYGIIAGIEGGKFIDFEDYKFNPLEESSDRERHENLKVSIESARTLIEMGGNREDVFDWLKSFKEFNLGEIELDEEADDLMGYEEEQPEVAEKVVEDDKIPAKQQPKIEKAQNTAFKEEDHPRDEDGKFSISGKGDGGKVEEEEEWRPNYSSIEDGKIYKEYKSEAKKVASALGSTARMSINREGGISAYIETDIGIIRMSDHPSNYDLSRISGGFDSKKIIERYNEYKENEKKYGEKIAKFNSEIEKAKESMRNEIPKNHILKALLKGKEIRKNYFKKGTYEYEIASRIENRDASVITQLILDENAAKDSKSNEVKRKDETDG